MLRHASSRRVVRAGDNQHQDPAAVVAGGVLASLVVFADRATRPPLTLEQSIRAAVESYLSACRDRDYEAVWNFQSRVTRGLIGAQRADLARVRLPAMDPASARRVPDQDHPVLATRGDGLAVLVDHRMVNQGDVKTVTQ